MDFLKKHYEKLILSVVLLGLAGAAALLPIKVSRIAEEVDATRSAILNSPNPGKAKPLDMTNHLAVLSGTKQFQGVQFGLPHLLFNPVTWERKPGGILVKHKTAGEVGPQALVATAVHPLYYEISLAGADETGRFQVSSIQQAEKNPRPRSRFLKLGDRNEQFLLREIKGTKEAPELVIDLLDEKKSVTLTKEKPYRSVSGYMADLVYPPENNRLFPKMRKDDKLSLARRSYKIIEINESEVVLSEESTERGGQVSGKRTVISVSKPKN